MVIAVEPGRSSEPKYIIQRSLCTKRFQRSYPFWIGGGGLSLLKIPHCSGACEVRAVPLLKLLHFQRWLVKISALPLNEGIKGLLIEMMTVMT